MPTEAVSFEHFMLFGLARRRQGKHMAASNQFKRAMSAASTDEQKTRAAQAMGIDLRLAGEYQEAEFAFDKALLFSGKMLKLKGIILRDFAMLHLDRGEFNLAKAKLEQSIKLLDGLDQLEKAVSKGFLGGLHYEAGRPWLAVQLLSEAYEDIKGQHDVYEMNHLIRWLKALEPWQRFQKFPRTLYLTVKTRHFERTIEATLITIAGPHLAEKIKRIKQGR